MKERILFREHDHVYFYETQLGEAVQQEKFTSVTTILSKLSPKKDFDKIAQDYYEKFVVNGSLDILFKDIGKKNKMSITECYDMWGELDYSNHKCIVKIWDDIKNKAAEKGTAYHLLREQEAYTKGAKLLITDGDFKVGHDLRTLTGNYSELILFHPFYKVSGSADVIEFDDNNAFTVRDYKTNKKKPEQKSFKNEKLLTPVSHLLACDYDKYTLQLSIYAFILEEYGYKCKELELIWIKDAEKDIRELIPVPYLKTEAKAILTYFKNNGYKL